MTMQEKLFSFQGRVTRKDYWFYTLALWGILLVLFLAIAGSSRSLRNDGLSTGGLVLAAIVVIAQIWPSLAISVKRCHDRNKSGWWMLLWMVLSAIPYVGILASLWCLVELGFLDGTQGPNRFGLSPKGLGGDLVAEAFT
ncbi:DUF805 domain-containing protein [Labrys wisconsinensis]|uniref:Uncharacterized membrane protein YhaH (DUF805 family) n=1 Tax=Labrys wisconsinensis TaxID=425677 RepID=A0ABU0JAV4_9HYPH|nr:DUF805 domain-containing protein [Labrys wisconsinensis]MDQ0470312.1 uncharacterized membrane protein YhaH (DUF805 family) [Labrys wisconsinensis]